MLLAVAAFSALLLSACQAQSHEQPEPQRVAFADANRAMLKPIDSPDTSKARWSVDAGGQAIDFGNPGAKPMLTLDCHLADKPPQMRIIRHVRARPGEGALFPVIGNGLRSRFLVDATLEGGEWRWEGAVAAADPMLDVFTGSHAITATLPGGGMLTMQGSRIPREFIGWCRAGGKVMAVEAAEKVEAKSAQPKPAPSTPAKKGR